jgi:hypothetical protein
VREVALSRVTEIIHATTIKCEWEDIAHRGTKLPRDGSPRTRKWLPTIPSLVPTAVRFDRLGSCTTAALLPDHDKQRYQKSASFIFH